VFENRGRRRILGLQGEIITGALREFTRSSFIIIMAVLSTHGRNIYINNK
jgi:hypothetical protein